MLILVLRKNLSPRRLRLWGDSNFPSNCLREDAGNEFHYHNSFWVMIPSLREQKRWHVLFEHVTPPNKTLPWRWGVALQQRSCLVLIRFSLGTFSSSLRMGYLHCCRYSLSLTNSLDCLTTEGDWTHWFMMSIWDHGSTVDLTMSRLPKPNCLGGRAL
jgi:hypothetical protein